MKKFFKKLFETVQIPKTLYISKETNITCLNRHHIATANVDIFVGDVIDGKAFAPEIFTEMVPGQLMKNSALCSKCNAPYFLDGRLHIEGTEGFHTTTNS